MDERDQESKGRFRVLDRRRFDTEGNEREADTESSRSAPEGSKSAGTETVASASQRPAAANSESRPQMNAPTAQSGAAATPRDTQPTPSGAENQARAEPRGGETRNMHGEPIREASARDGEVDFSSFIMSLATQALVQLGEVPPPNGLSLPVDKVAAKHTIDILTMLDEKTRGNLDPGEQHLLSEILYELRVRFVRHA